MLNSKRLLTEHVEILEDFLNFRQIKKGSVIPHRFWLIGGSFSLACYISPDSITLKSCPLWVCYGYLLWKLCREYEDLSGLNALLENLTNYQTDLRKILSFLTDLNHVTRGHSPRERQLATICLESCVRIVKLLHQFVTTIDGKHPLSNTLINYEPFEDLPQFNLLGENSYRNFKTIFPIFLFIQSQFLLRLTVAMVDKQDFKWSELNNIISELRKETVTLKEKSNIKTNTKEYVGDLIKCSDLMEKSCDDDLCKLKWTSANLSAKLMVQMNLFERFNEKLATERNLNDLNEDLTEIQPLFEANAWEYNNLLILMRRLLNQDAAGEKKTALELTLGEQEAEEKKGPFKYVDQSTVISIDDEFFIQDGQFVVNDANASDLPPIEEQRNEKLLKSCFKPVLKQLRKQINPINQEMNERERRFMQEQGVLIPTPAETKELPTESSEDELDDNLVLRKKNNKKLIARPSKYDENRQFLAAKVQMGMLRLPTPLVNPSNEDVLE